MPANGSLKRRILGSLILGICVGLANRILDIFFARIEGPRDTNVLNDLIIGAAAGVLAYIWVSRQDVKHAVELSKEKLTQEAVHQERKRIAVELHDTVCQAHTAAVMQLEFAADFLEHNLEAREYVDRARQLVRGSTSEMRCALWDLYPEELEKLDLKNAIEYLVKDLTAGNPLHVQFSITGTVRRLPLEIEKGLLRIGQEALWNVVKHARAHEAQIELFLDFEEVRLLVKDDGQGFESEVKAGRFGLASMRERTRALGGVFVIRSEPGHGTEVCASIPVPSW